MSLSFLKCFCSLVGVVCFGLECVANEQILTIKETIDLAYLEELSLKMQRNRIKALKSQYSLKRYEKGFKFDLVSSTDYLVESTSLESGSSELDIGRSNVGVMVSKVLYDGNKLAREIKLSEFNLEKAKIDYKAQKNDLTKKVINHYFNLFEEILFLRYLSLEREMLEIEEKEYEAQYALGKVYHTDLMEKSLERLKLQQSIIVREQRKAELVYELSQLVGQDLSQQSLFLTQDIGKISDTGVKFIVARASAENMFFEEEGRSLKDIYSSIRSLSRKQNDWRVSLQGRAGFNVARDFDRGLEAEGENVFLSLRFEFPIFNKGERMNRLSLVSSVYEAASLGVQAEIQEERLDLMRLVKELRLAEENVVLGRSRLELARIKSYYVEEMNEKGDVTAVESQLQDIQWQKIDLDLKRKIVGRNRLLLRMCHQIYREDFWEEWQIFVKDYFTEVEALKVSMHARSEQQE